jgi:hypothetical protein
LAALKILVLAIEMFTRSSASFNLIFCFFYAPIIALLLLAIYDDKFAHLKHVILCGVIAFMFDWLLFIPRKDFSFLSLLASICYPLLMLIFSFISFKKSKIDVAKGFVFILFCSFLNSSMLSLSKMIFPQYLPEL